MLTLIIETEGEVPRTLRLTQFPSRIGRLRENPVRLQSWRVAGIHAEIHRIERGFKLVDCGSLGGTWVNGERIVEYAPLADDDEISIAGFRLRAHPTLRLVDSSNQPRPQDSTDADGSDTGVDDVSAAERAAVPAGSGLEWRRLLHRRLLAAIDLRRQDIRQLSAAQLRAEAQSLLIELLSSDDVLPADIDRVRLIEEVLDEAIGLGPLEPLLADDSITEIMVNSADEIFIERHGRLERTAAAFTSDDAIRATIDRVVTPLGRRIDEGSPMVDARLPDGSRVNAIIPPLAIRGPSITIRRFNRRLFGPQDLVEIGSLSDAMLEFLHVCVASRRNIIVSGGTGSGKTTLLNLLSNLIPQDQRVVTIEDAAELRLRHEHCVSLEARPANAEGRGQVAIRDLVRNALRMRPDRIVVGECRGGEALDMLQAMNTGHDGSLTTVHANSSRDVVSRLETMVLMAGVDMPVTAIREQIVSAVDVIVHQARTADGGRRIVEIVELTGLEGSRVLMQPLFRYDKRGTDRAGGGRFVGCGNVPEFYETLRAEGHPLDLGIFQEQA
ncbi:MAG: Flp pilus assembly complex ATPase component TadA [Burkholderiales bacterium]|nr:Flp pilus assembly complex ATPase component TadA [Burkholderiales bacterium]